MGESRRNMTPEELAARRAIRELPDAEPDTAFRDRLRAQFVAGASEEAADGTAQESAPATRSSRPSRARSSRPRSTRRPDTTDTKSRRPLRLVIGGTLAAAAAVVVMLLLVGDDAPTWQAYGEVAEGITVNGQPVTPTTVAWNGGETVETGDKGITLRTGNMMMLDLSPNTRVVLPSAEGGGEMVVEFGEIRVVTGVDPMASPLQVRTDEIQVDVTGTSFAVLHIDMGTCVCVLDGHVDMSNLKGPETNSVPAGKRWFVFTDGREEGVKDVMPEHEQALQKLHDVAKAALR